MMKSFKSYLKLIVHISILYIIEDFIDFQFEEQVHTNFKVTSMKDEKLFFNRFSDTSHCYFFF